MKGLHKVAFVNGSHLLVRSGMHGATLNIYCGLSEPADMIFAFHILRKGDLFLDVGANVGVYSILACTSGATVIAFEPVPSTYTSLQANIVSNGFESQATAINTGVGSSSETLRFSSEHDAMNRVVLDDEQTDSVAIRVEPLDALVKSIPILIKIDVEGFETEVLRGARKILNNSELRAVIIEINGAGLAYGFSDDGIRAELASFGFTPFEYDYETRTLKDLISPKTSGNTIFVRDVEFVLNRVRKARPLKTSTGLSF